MKSKVVTSPVLRRIDLEKLIGEVCEAFEERCTTQGIAISRDVPQNLWVDVDPILMKEAFRKLIDNSIEAMPAGGTLTITSLIGRHGLEIEFADTGKGIPEDVRDRLFEPFATSKATHAGLGLSLVRDISLAHHGSIAVQDCPDGGTAFTMLLPIRDVQRQAA